MIHEEEIADLRVQQQKMMAVREAEMSELRRLEEQEFRLQGEKVCNGFVLSTAILILIMKSGASSRGRCDGRPA